MKNVSFLLVICIFSFFLYHGCVVKTQRGQEAKFKAKYKLGEISRKEFENFWEQDTYWRTFFNFEEVLKAWM